MLISSHSLAGYNSNTVALACPKRDFFHSSNNLDWLRSYAAVAITSSRVFGSIDHFMGGHPLDQTTSTALRARKIKGGGGGLYQTTDLSQ